MRRAFVAILALAAALFGAAGPAEAQNRFWLINGTGTTIQEAYVSPSRLSNWGPDILGSSVLAPGQQVWVTPNFGDCMLDVRVRYANGAEDTRMGVNACSLSRIVFGSAGATIGGSAGATVSPGPAVVGNPSFTFVNQSGATIRELYVSLTTQRNWGQDRLGSNVLAPGQSIGVSLPATGVCTVDMRVVYMNGAAAERRGVETCSVNAYGWR